MANTNNASKSTKKGWKGTIFIVVLLAAIFAIAKPISNWIAGLGSSFQFESSSWITLIVILAILGLLIYAVYKMTKKEKPADPHKAPDPHGGGAAADPHHGKPTKTFLHMFGFFTILFFVVYGAWNMFSSAHKNKEEREAAEEKARLNDPYATHTSSSKKVEESDTAKWTTLTLNDDEIILLEQPAGTHLYWKVTGDKVDTYFGNDTTNISNNLHRFSLGDRVSTSSCTYLAFKKVPNYPNKLMYTYKINSGGTLMPNPVFLK